MAKYHDKLSRGREFRDNTRQHINALGEGCERDALIIAMHTLVLLLGQRKRHQSVSLHVVQPQLR